MDESSDYVGISRSTLVPIPNIPWIVWTHHAGPPAVATIHGREPTRDGAVTLGILIAKRDGLSLIEFADYTRIILYAPDPT